MYENEIRPFPRHLINDTPATIRAAWDNTKPVLCDSNGDVGNVNLSSIATILIQNCGRFAESYASDFLITWKHVEDLCNMRYRLEEPIDEIFGYGIRKSGVDHNAYILNRLYDTRTGGFDRYVHHDSIYRRTLAVRVHIAPSEYDGKPYATVELKDLSNAFHRIDPSDMDDKGQLIHGPYQTNPIPAADLARRKAGDTDV